MCRLLVSVSVTNGSVFRKEAWYRRKQFPNPFLLEQSLSQIIFFPVISLKVSTCSKKKIEKEKTVSTRQNQKFV